MITHLISTTEFVKLINSIEIKQCSCAEEFDAKIAENYGKIIRYVNFISQKPTLGMFVPVDEEGNVLEELIPYQGISETTEHCRERLSKYQETQSKVLFKGWKITDNFDKVLWLNNNKIIYSKLDNRIYKEDCSDKDAMVITNTLEELIDLKLELTETALKQIGI